MTENGVNKFSEMMYDSRNLPIFILKDDSTEIIYQYNSEGQRIFKKVDNAAHEHYLMDGSLNLGVFQADGSLQHWNLLADGVAGRVASDGTESYYLTDHLGSTCSVIDQTGSVQESYDYYPFGLKMPGRFLDRGTKELFTGKERNNKMNTAADFLLYLVEREQSRHILQVLKNAPEEDEAPDTEELEAIREAEKDIADGRV